MQLIECPWCGPREETEFHYGGQAHVAYPEGPAALTDEQIVELSQKFGAYFESQSPTVDQIRKAISRTLARWPIGSLGE